MKIVNLLLFFLLSFTANSEQISKEIKWNDEQQEIIEVNRFFSLALKQGGFNVYADLFHPDYTN